MVEHPRTTMRKRRHTVIFLSDDEEDADDGNRQKAAFHKAEPFFAPQANSSSLQTNADHLEKYGLAKRQELKCPTQLPDKQPWTEKYSPRDIADLVVHSKKIADVREWMVAKLQIVNKLHNGSNVLVLSGPTGAGKTAVVHVLVNQFQEAELCEWDSPVPTLWKDHLHHVNADVPYVSKVDQFIDFLDRVKKYPLLPLERQLQDEANTTLFIESTSTGGKHKVLLIDDLPLVHGRDSISKLCHCLHNFALSVQFPTVVIATDLLENEEFGQGTSFLTADIIQALESGGAKKVLFNPLTANTVKKVLNKILLAEKCTISSESVSFIAESCGGDIRHAINCLQFLCVGLKAASCSWDPGGDSRFLENPKRQRGTRDGSQNKSKRSVKRAMPAFDGTLSIGCRDGSLSLFHALGKVLNNKRLTEEDKDSGKSSINFILKHELQRHPLNMEAPEILISKSHADAASFLYFLHENVLEFVNEEGIEDVSIAFTYFSDVDCLLNHKKPNSSARSSLPFLDEIDPGHIAEAAAGSLAARGALFANTHPEKPRWLSLRAPVIRQVDRLINEKKADLRAKSWGIIFDHSTMFTHTVHAAEFEPFYKCMGCTPFSASQSKMPSRLPNTTMAVSSWATDQYKLPFLLSQDLDLLPNITAIDISKGMDIDAMSNVSDEIEEW